MVEKNLTLKDIMTILKDVQKSLHLDMKTLEHKQLLYKKKIKY